MTSRRIFLSVCASILLLALITPVTSTRICDGMRVGRLHLIPPPGRSIAQVQYRACPNFFSDPTLPPEFLQSELSFLKSSDPDAFGRYRVAAACSWRESRFMWGTLRSDTARSIPVTLRVTWNDGTDTFREVQLPAPTGDDHPEVPVTFE